MTELAQLEHAALADAGLLLRQAQPVRSRNDNATYEGVILPVGAKGEEVLSVAARFGRQVVIGLADYPGAVRPDSPIAAFARVMGGQFNARDARMTIWPEALMRGLGPQDLLSRRRVLISAVDFSGKFPQVTDEVRFATPSLTKVPKHPITRGGLRINERGRRALGTVAECTKLAMSFLADQSASGAYVLDLPEAGIATDSTGAVAPRPRGLSGDTRPDYWAIQRNLVMAFNIATTLGARRHRVPLLYTDHVFNKRLPAERFEAAFRLGELSVATQFGVVTYTPDPKGHEALGRDAYATFGGPDTSFADFVNLANLHALILRRPYPYPFEQLQAIADELNEVAELQRTGQRMLTITEYLVALSSLRFGAEAFALPPLSANALFARAVREGFMTDNHLAVLREVCDKGELRSSVLLGLLTNKHLGHPIWDQAFAIAVAAVRRDPKHINGMMGALGSQPGMGLTPIFTRSESGGELALWDASGNEIASHTAPTRVEAILGALARLAGRELPPLKETKGVPHHLPSVGTPADQPHGRELVLEHVVPPSCQLEKVLGEYGLGAPRYTFQSRGPKEPLYRCQVVVIDAEGGEHSKVGSARSKKAAIEDAATLMLAAIMGNAWAQNVADRP